MLFKFLFFQIVIGLILSCGFAAEKNIRFITPDFFIETITTKNSITSKNNQSFQSEISNCKERIREIVCLVDPIDEKSDSKKRDCLPGGENYFDVFEKIYEFYPEALQKVFCSLKVIYIEKQFIGTAYAGTIEDENNNSMGAVMGIRKSVIDEQLSLEKWASWKEQLSFGGISDSYSVTPNLPTIKNSTSEGRVNEFLYFVIAHEFGHILDFSNHLNETTNQCEIDPKTQEPIDCKLKENSWGSISWDSTKKPKIENDFLNRNNLCFYWCNGKSIEFTQIPQLYEDLWKTDFISIYATTQPWDDFADSFAYFLVNKNLNLNYYIHTNQGASYDIMEKIKSTKWSKKFQYIDHFIHRSDIIYP